jgi:hypothetical protein
MSLLNTLFTAHRVSPLHLGPEPLTPERLELLSRRLRDLLVGDTVRGVHLGLDGGVSTDAALHNQAGALERVEFAWVGVRELLRDGGGEGSDDRRDEAAEQSSAATGPSALRLELRYENSGGSPYAAFLLPELAADRSDGANVVTSANPLLSRKKGDSQSQQWEAHPMVPAPSVATTQDEADTSRFVQLPLLLLRLPAPLRAVVTEFLAQTFDARVSALSFDSATLIGTFEQWVAESGTAGSRDVAVTLGFYASQVLRGATPTNGMPQQRTKDSGIERSGTEEDHTTGMDERQSLGLKTIDVVIPAEEVSSFVRAGRLEKNRPGRRRVQPLEPSPQPFTNALAAYLDRHLALDMKHPAVSILRIACDGFVLSEGRVKILEGGDGRAHKAVWSLLGRLVRQAKGHSLGS